MIERFHVSYVIDPLTPMFGTERLPEYPAVIEVETKGLSEQDIFQIIRDEVTSEHGGVIVEAYPINAAGERIER